MSVFYDKMDALKKHLQNNGDVKGLELYEDFLILLNIHLQQTKEYLTKVKAIVN